MSEGYEKSRKKIKKPLDKPHKVWYNKSTLRVMTYIRKVVVMTYREFFSNVASANISDELTDFANAAIVKLDNRNAKRSSKPSKTAIANEPIKVGIVDFLRNGSHVASEIGVALNISTNKASALCRQLVEDGKLSVTDVKVKGKGTVKQYKVVE